MMRKLLSLMTLASAVALCGSAHAQATLTFDFGKSEGVADDHYYGVTSPFTSTAGTGPTLTATAQGPNIPGPNNDGGLYFKDDGTNETGLGIRPDSGSDTEIDRAHDVLFDFTALKAAGYATTTFKIGSSQQGEGYKITAYDASNNATVLATYGNYNPTGDPLYYTVSTADFAKYTSYSITAIDGSPDSHLPNANIVIETVTVATPEPSTLVMASISLFTGAGAWLRRRRLSA